MEKMIAFMLAFLLACIPSSKGGDIVDKYEKTQQAAQDEENVLDALQDKLADADARLTELTTEIVELKAKIEPKVEQP